MSLEYFVPLLQTNKNSASVKVSFKMQYLCSNYATMKEGSGIIFEVGTDKGFAAD